MRKLGLYLLTLGVILLSVSPAMAQQSLVSTVAEGCKAEIERYCANVTAGEGRVLACLYAYNDRLSGRCEYALFDAASQLQRAVSALAYAAHECTSDLEKYCADVAAGKGRLLECLQRSDAKVSGRCKQALKDVGLK